MRKLKEILLIDDSKGTNTLNIRLLKQMGIVENISTALNGQLALDYLTSKNEENEYPNPDLIFLDINMPVMDGYQFLEAYDKLVNQVISKKIIVMLTTSIREIDINRAKNYSSVIGYHSKPLTFEKINKIINQSK